MVANCSTQHLVNGDARAKRLSNAVGLTLVCSQGKTSKHTEDHGETSQEMAFFSS